MDGYKLASVAGMVTMAASVFVEYSVPCLVQVQSQPGQTQPGHTQPGQPRPGETPTRPGQPGQGDRPGLTRPGQPGQAPGIRGINEPRAEEKSLFQLREESAQRTLEELGRKLARIEEQLKDSQQQLINQLNQARLLDGDQKVDALAEVVQGLAQQHMEINGYLTDLREAVTGKVSSGRIQGIPEPEDDVKDDLDREIYQIEKDLQQPKDPKPDAPREPAGDPGMPR